MKLEVTKEYLKHASSRNIEAKRERIRIEINRMIIMDKKLRAELVKRARKSEGGKP